MKLHNKNAEIFIPDNKPVDEAISRTTHMAVAAHQDDLEIMAYDGILKCFGHAKNWFLGVTVTDGSGSPRDGRYANYPDEKMLEVRKVEQKKAATLGEYGAVVFLDYLSAAVKDPKNTQPKEDIKALLSSAQPDIVYTHNLADKHDTHVGLGLRTIQAIRELPANLRPQSAYGCEVWRDLDWMIDQDKVAFDVSAHEDLAASLLRVFDSQICGGKRYDLATLGRRKANATYHAAHKVDLASSMIYAMDLTPLIKDPQLDITTYVKGHIERFTQEVTERISKL